MNPYRTIQIPPKHKLNIKEKLLRILCTLKGHNFKSHRFEPVQFYPYYPYNENKICIGELKRLRYDICHLCNEEVIAVYEPVPYIWTNQYTICSICNGKLGCFNGYFHLD